MRVSRAISSHIPFSPLSRHTVALCYPQPLKQAQSSICLGQKWHMSLPGRRIKHWKVISHLPLPLLKRSWKVTSLSVWVPAWLQGPKGPLQTWHWMWAGRVASWNASPLCSAYPTDEVCFGKVVGCLALPCGKFFLFASLGMTALCSVMRMVHSSHIWVWHKPGSLILCVALGNQSHYLWQYLTGSISCQDHSFYWTILTPPSYFSHKLSFSFTLLITQSSV